MKCYFIPVDADTLDGLDSADFLEETELDSETEP